MVFEDYDDEPKGSKNVVWRMIGAYVVGIVLLILIALSV